MKRTNAELRSLIRFVISPRSYGNFPGCAFPGDKLHFSPATIAFVMETPPAAKRGPTPRTIAMAAEIVKDFGLETTLEARIPDKIADKMRDQYYEARSGLGHAVAESLKFYDRVNNFDNEESPELVRVMVTGRPGVGKSQMVNSLLGHDLSPSGMSDTALTQLPIRFHFSPTRAGEAPYRVSIHSAAHSLHDVGFWKSGDVREYISTFSRLLHAFQIDGLDALPQTVGGRRPTKSGTNKRTPGDDEDKAPNGGHSKKARRSSKYPAEVGISLPYDGADRVRVFRDATYIQVTIQGSTLPMVELVDLPGFDPGNEVISKCISAELARADSVLVVGSRFPEPADFHRILLYVGTQLRIVTINIPLNQEPKDFEEYNEIVRQVVLNKRVLSLPILSKIKCFGWMPSIQHAPDIRWVQRSEGDTTHYPSQLNEIHNRAVYRLRRLARQDLIEWLLPFGQPLEIQVVFPLERICAEAINASQMAALVKDLFTNQRLSIPFADQNVIAPKSVREVTSEGFMTCCCQGKACNFDDHAPLNALFPVLLRNFVIVPMLKALDDQVARLQYPHSGWLRRALIAHGFTFEETYKHLTLAKLVEARQRLEEDLPELSFYASFHWAQEMNPMVKYGLSNWRERTLDRLKNTEPEAYQRAIAWQHRSINDYVTLSPVQRDTISKAMIGCLEFGALVDLKSTWQSLKTFVETCSFE